MAQLFETEITTSEHKPREKILASYNLTLGVIAFPILEGLENITKEVWQR